MSDTVVRFSDVGKMYKIFGTRRDNLLEVLGFHRLMGDRTSRYQEFWALRGIDLDLQRGERLGIIGRNGAGKSTLLRLITGNIPPSEGDVAVNGNVQALLEVGGGLHPEFTGRENIRAALGFMGLGPGEIEEATVDISEFTELGRFLDQPFKTYSQGMQARLSFAIATATTPEILIVDEILGAGDAYFFGRSTERMRKLIDGGASVLLVSHALDQVTRFCPETIWLDRGRVVMRGPTNEVVKAYESFIRKLDDRRIQAKNRKSRSRNFDAFEREGYTAQLLVRVTPVGSCDVASVTLYRDEEVEDSILLGAAQDADVSQTVHLDAASGWSGPLSGDDGVFHRALQTRVAGGVFFHLWFLYPDSDYRVEIRYRAQGGRVDIEVERDATVEVMSVLPEASEWTTGTVPLQRRQDEESVVRSRWEGTGALIVDQIRLLDAQGEECGIFDVGAELSLEVDITASTAGTFPLIPAAIVFRADGVSVTRHVGDQAQLDVREGDRIKARLDLGKLLLGNGVYLVSLGLYSKLDLADVEPSEFYDYYDKSFEFKIVGNPTVHNELVLHPGDWTVVVTKEPTPAQMQDSEARPARL